MSSESHQREVLKVADRQTDGQTDGVPDDDNKCPAKFWLRPKNTQL